MESCMLWYNGDIKILYCRLKVICDIGRGGKEDEEMHFWLIIASDSWSLHGGLMLSLVAS